MWEQLTETYFADIGSIGLGQENFRNIWGQVDRLLIIFPGFNVLALCWTRTREIKTMNGEQQNWHCTTSCYKFEYWTDLVDCVSVCFGQDQWHRFHVLGELELVWLLAIQMITKNLSSFLGLKDVQWSNGHPSSSFDKFHVSLVHSLQIDLTENLLNIERKIKNSLKIE